MRDDSFNVVCCMALGDAQARYHVLPLALSLDRGVVWVVRPSRITGPLPANVRQLIAPFRWRWLAILWIAWRCWQLARRDDVAAVVSFNPFPYGIVTAMAAALVRKPFHLGWVGTDWHVRMRRGWGRIGRWMLRRAAFVTVSGARMEAEIGDKAGPLRRLAVLPHCIDLERFPLVKPKLVSYDIVFVGRLVRVKRVDVLLEAVARLVSQYASLRVAIAGDGPLAPQLHRLSRQLGLCNVVHFVGAVSDVPALLRTCEIFVMCSESEGFPFALIEAMCSGLLPIVTPVGDIPTVVKTGLNGWLVPVGDASALAEALTRLLDDPALRASMRTEALLQRANWNMDRAVAVWKDWFATLEVQSACPGTDSPGGPIVEQKDRLLDPSLPLHKV